MRVLIVEDDRPLAAALARILQDAGYEADAVHDGEQGVRYAESDMYDVIVLDVMLPKKDGFAVVLELRRAGVSTPTLLLTARDSVPDKITGLDSGADDYMTKPFSPAELLAHIRALTRRQGDVALERLMVGDVVLDLNGYCMVCGSKSIRLSYKEFCVLKILMSNAGVVVSKEMLISKAWGADSNAGDNNVEVYISFLRKKLSHLGSMAKIETIRKVGYRFVSQEDAECETAGARQCERGDALC